jgi:hypothetical protein
MLLNFYTQRLFFRNIYGGGSIMKTIISIAIGIFFLSTLCLASNITSLTSAKETDDAQSLVMTACTKCHDTNKICKKIGKKSREKWDKTVSRMIKKGAELPEDKKDLVIDYLLSLEPGSKPVCP